MSVYLHFDSIARRDVFLCKSNIVVRHAVSESMAAIGVFNANSYIPTNPGRFSVDGLTFNQGDRILVWRETDYRNNGIYRIEEIGPSPPALLVRETGYQAGDILNLNNTYLQIKVSPSDTNTTLFSYNNYDYYLSSAGSQNNYYLTSNDRYTAPFTAQYRNIYIPKWSVEGEMNPTVITNMFDYIQYDGVSVIEQEATTSDIGGVFTLLFLNGTYNFRDISINFHNSSGANHSVAMNLVNITDITFNIFGGITSLTPAQADELINNYSYQFLSTPKNTGDNITGDVYTWDIGLQTVTPGFYFIVFHDNDVDNLGVYSFPSPIQSTAFIELVPSSGVVVGTDSLLFKPGCKYEVNDFSQLNTTAETLLTRYTAGVLPDSVQMPTKFTVYNEDIDQTIPLQSLESNKFDMEFCTAILPTSTSVMEPVYDINYNVISTNYRSIVNEPYIYINIKSVNESTPTSLYSNNPAANDATFVLWQDKYIQGSEDQILPNSYIGESASDFITINGKQRWVVFKSCMNITLHFDLDSNAWNVRYFDRNGRDLILTESSELVEFPSENEPPPEKYKQTTFVLGMRPNYT